MRYLNKLSLLIRYLSNDSRGIPRVAIIGSGPAGFYTARQLIKSHDTVRVDILESLPVPFGLVRFGIAPDHPEVKNVINQFTTLAQSERCKFYGNIHFGRDITLTQLKSLYSAIVFAYGAEGDKLMNIPGEDTKGVYSARAFVGWYNGLPSHTDLNVDLTRGDTAVIIGQGNVALDVARMLLTPVELLQKTDICSHALEALSHSTIKKVIVVGRRGPLEVSFTIKELREMIRLPQCQTHICFDDIKGYESVIESLPRPRKRITELMKNTASGDVDDSLHKSWELKFLRSPVECLSASNGYVSGIKLEVNKLQVDKNGYVRAVGTGKYESIDCSLILRSIGYKGISIDPNVPFDKRSGVILNNRGRVINDHGGDIINGLYCSGWIKRGPTGVILDTMNDAFETAGAIIFDYFEGKLVREDESSDCQFNKVIKMKGINIVPFSGWERIDREEQKRGAVNEKPREKITSIEEMLRIALD